MLDHLDDAQALQRLQHHDVIGRVDPGDVPDWLVPARERGEQRAHKDQWDLVLPPQPGIDVLGALAAFILSDVNRDDRTQRAARRIALSIVPFALLANLIQLFL